MGGQESCTEPHRGVANDGHPRNFTRAVKFLWISRQILSVCRDDRTLSFPLERARLALALKRNLSRRQVPPVFKAVDSRIPTGACPVMRFRCPTRPWDQAPGWLWAYSSFTSPARERRAALSELVNSVAVNFKIFK